MRDEAQNRWNLSGQVCGGRAGGGGDQKAIVFPKASLAAEWMVSVAN